MRKITTFFLLCFSFSFTTFSQKRVYEEVTNARNQQTAQSYSVFSISPHVTIFDENIFVAGGSYSEFIADETNLRQLEREKPNFLNLAIPISSKNNIVLELIPIDIFSPTYKVLNSTNEVVSINKGVYYQGIIQGDSKSLVSIGIANGEISGIISNDKGNFILGKLQNSTNYIYYNDHDLVQKSGFTCGVVDNEIKKMVDEQIQNNVTGTNVACRAVQVYVEADNAIYTAQGSNMTTATNFVNALFGQVGVLYYNENLAIQISELKIWDTTDPYISTSSTGAMLDAFDTQVGSTFNGDIAHLISGRSLGGGVAWVDVLCNKGTGISANISNTVVNVPTYSWNVEVVTHEMGHNFGSPHTQSCSWPIGALDNCVSTEGGCAPGPAPTNGGTIMSYCHLTSYGINFNNGFGTYPGNLIRNRAQSCFGSAVSPTDLTVLETYSTSVILAWTANAGTATIEYKPTSSSTWTTVTSTSNTIQLTGLTANTAYNWRVKVSCSIFSNSTFTTNNTPPITYCGVNFTTGCNTFAIGINDVIIGGVNYNPSSGCATTGGYTYKFNPVQNLTIGQTYSITINQIWIGSNPVQAAIWIDYDKNGTFDTSEKVFTTTSNTTSPITGSFTVPSGITAKTKCRMRVILQYYNAPTNPCGTYTYGEAEDFQVNINSPCPTTVTLVHPTNNITTGSNNLIQATANIGGSINASNHITGSGTKATYEARVINLTEGFIAENGTVFSAITGGCN